MITLYVLGHKPKMTYGILFIYRPHAIQYICLVLQSPVRSVARLAEFAIGVAALIWLGSHARPLVVDPQHRRRVIADVRTGISAARNKVQDHISRISHDARQAKETVKSKAGEAMEEIVMAKQK